MLKRGAGSSKGKTSWTAKPELADYVSFAGFFIHYLHALEPPLSTSPPPPKRSISDRTLTPIQSMLTVPTSPTDSTQDASMTLIFGGYSYGSLIATHLPSTYSIIERFADTAKGTAETEICLRAQHLSQQWNKYAQQDIKTRRGRSSYDSDPKSPSISVAFGGEETEPGSRRPSRESRRSVDRVRKSLDGARKHLTHHRQHSSEEEGYTPDPTLKPVNIPLPKTHYLLISPLLPPTSLFLTCFSQLGQTATEKHHHTYSATEHNEGNESKLVSNPAMAIYGDDDMFVSQRKLRKWAESLTNRPGSKFHFHEVAGAGHFWHEVGVDVQLRDFVKAWVQDLAGEQSSKPINN